MAIVFQCTCGRPLRTSAEYAGKKTKCPGCGQVLTIPTVEAKIPTPVTVPASPPEDDPFSLNLDWSALETPKIPDSDQIHSSSGVIKIDTGFDTIQTSEIPRTEDGSKQYHVLTQKDMGFAKFNQIKVEEVLNLHARQGWSLKSSFVMNIPGHGGNHDELILILER